MGKRKSALQRLRERKRSQELFRALVGGSEWLGQILAERESTDWNDPVKRASVAHRALRVGSGKALKKAFAFFELDPQNPFHWHQLVSHLAEILFGQRRGRKKEWTDERLCELLSDAHQVSERMQNPTQRNIWQHLTRHNRRYKGVPYDTWRKQLKTAIRWAVSERENRKAAQQSFPKRTRGN
jgi:hypothetical protein